MRSVSALALVSLAGLVAVGAGCQLVGGVTPCTRPGESCPTGEACDAKFGVCTVIAAPVTPAADGEGEGEGVAGANEGEGGAGEGEGEGSAGEGEGSVGGEGEGANLVGEGEGEGAPKVALCGDGVVDSGEACDDGNRVSGDGCSATCRFDATVAESESNDLPSDVGPLEITPIPGSTVITGSITTSNSSSSADFYGFPRAANPPFTDFDGFWLNVPVPTVVRIENFDVDGADDCADSLITTALYANDIPQHGPDSTFLREADTNGVHGCNVLTVAADALSYWVVSTQDFADQAVPTYHTQIVYLVDRGTETEPNNTPATAEPGVADGHDLFMSGSISNANDVDVYAVRVPAGQGLRAEAIPTATSLSCDQFNVDISLLDASGGRIIDHPSRFGACAFVDGTGATPDDPEARNSTSASDTVYVAVSKGGANFGSAIPYKVTFTVH